MEEHKEEHPTVHIKHDKKGRKEPSVLMIWLIAFAAVLILFNQWQLAQLSAVTEPATSQKSTSKAGTAKFMESKDLEDVTDEDIEGIQNTAQGIALLYPISEIKNAEDAMSVMIPTGTPFYGEEIGVSYDDPISALNFFYRELYPRISRDIKENDPEVWERYLNLAVGNRGVACEFCCGVGAQGITNDGKLRCGCSHNPAIQSIVLYLMKYYPDMSDAEVLRELYNWKSIWFPKNMIGLAMQMAGGDTSALETVPGMVGGC